MIAVLQNPGKSVRRTGVNRHRDKQTASFFCWIHIQPISEAMTRGPQGWPQKFQAPWVETEPQELERLRKEYNLQVCQGPFAWLSGTGILNGFLSKLLCSMTLRRKTVEVIVDVHPADDQDLVRQAFRVQPSHQALSENLLLNCVRQAVVLLLGPLVKNEGTLPMQAAREQS